MIMCIEDFGLKKPVPTESPESGKILIFLTDSVAQFEVSSDETTKLYEIYYIFPQIYTGFF